MSGAQIVDGWIQVPYTGDDFTPAYIGVGTTAEPTEWLPAFLDYDTAGQRVAQIRPPSPMLERAVVWLRVGGRSTQVGRVR